VAEAHQAAHFDEEVEEAHLDEEAAEVEKDPNVVAAVFLEGDHKGLVVVEEKPQTTR
jgi:hypothetical protein